MNEGQQTKQKSGSKGAVVVLLILLLASVGGNIWQYFNTREVQIVSEKMTMQMDTLTARKIELEKEFTTVSTELDQFRGRSAEMDSLLAEADLKIEEQRKQISGLIEQKKDYQILQARYADLQKLKNTYLEEIDRLMAENKELKYQNVTLSVKVDKLGEEKAELSEKVAYASALKIQNVRLTPFKIMAKGKQKEVEKANKADRISIKFTVLPNKLSENGPKTAYVRIINPAGLVIADVSESTKKFGTRDGKELPYSRQITFDYDGTASTREVNWEQEAFSTGTYKIEIYIDGDYAGGESVVLQ
jgi:predicted nuclease with TOPRIM domain